MLQIKNIKIATAQAGIKSKNRDDVLLIKFDEIVQVAGVFARSSFTATPVNWCKKILENGKALALIVNSGNANSFTGNQGDAALERVVGEAAKLLSCEKEAIFMSSTGVIGEVLKDEKITDKLPELIANLSNETQNWEKAAKAIMTTDLKPKYSCRTAKIGKMEVKINGFCKGSGMIAPNMATMLGYIFTDANINSMILQRILSDICDRTFNAITVDSDQSTNDTVLLFATKSAKNTAVPHFDSELLHDFKAKLEELMLELAQKIVIDGEGATKLIEIKVSGAHSKEVAKKIAFSIANSPLVKTAIAGEDPNWGRIVMAIGKTEEKFNQDELNINIGEFEIVKNGEKSPNYSENAVHQYLKNENVKIDIVVGKNSKNNFTAWTCDLTEEYIKINKDYRS